MLPVRSKSLHHEVEGDHLLRFGARHIEQEKFDPRRNWGLLKCQDEANLFFKEMIGLILLGYHRLNYLVSRMSEVHAGHTQGAPEGLEGPKQARDLNGKIHEKWLDLILGLAL